MLRSLLAAAALLSLAACGEPPAPVGPPEGWTAVGPDRWIAAGADTAAAFRDLSSFEAMDVALVDDPYDRWVQEQLLPIYRSNPEVADSVFRAEFAPALDSPGGADWQQAAATAANTVKRDFYQRFNGSRKVPGAAIVVPDSLAGVRGDVVLQVYVAPDKRPLGVWLVEGTGTALDALAMREAATSTYTDGWVRPTAGPSAGVNIPTWVRVTQAFGTR